MKKLISIFAVSLVLVFSCVPAFAESQVIEGYAVQDVPYNEAFEGVLTASDNGSQLYSSTNDKTYNTPSVLAAPATSSSAIYYYKSVTNFIPSNIWRGANSPTITFPVSNGYTGVKYVWAESKDSNSVWHYNEGPKLTKLQAGRKYRFTFNLKILTRVKGNFTFGLSSVSDFNNYVLKFVDKSAPAGGGDMLSSASRAYSLDLTLPQSVNDILFLQVKANVYGKEFEFYINDFTITDITTEDLDNSINQGVEKIENAGSDSPPLDTDISAFQSAIDTMNGWLDQLNEFADTIDSAGDTAKDYISKGTELFNGFMGVAPASVIALVAFGIVFLVIRKIVGR